MTFYGHTKEDARTKQTLPKDEWQLLQDHLSNVARLSAERAGKFGAAQLGNLIGLTHDLGKYSAEFQQRLEGKKIKVDHATAGAQELNKRLPKPIGIALAYPIAGHHGGLPDGNKGALHNLPERLANHELPKYQAYASEIELPQLVNEDFVTMPKAKSKEMAAFSFYFCIRMLFSCLTDADYLDTERFMNPEKFSSRPTPEKLSVLLSRLENKLAELSMRNQLNPSKINIAREEILQRCLEMAEKKAQLFTLTVPTGGGKTYSSLAFALKHAVKYEKERIIYVIPYTSIIEQNAHVFRDAFEVDS